MIEQMYWACSDAVTLATQLGHARDLPSMDILTQRIAGVFEQMAEKARRFRIPDADVAEARYALCAFMDEQILRSEWSGRQDWMSQPLQLIYFNENTAGEGFFTRLEALEQQPARVHVLQIYYLCLTLGFQGQYAVRGGEGISAIVERLANRLARHLPRTAPLSPHGELLSKRRAAGRSELPLLALSVGFLVFSVLLFIVLRVVVSSDADKAVQQLKTLSPAGSASQK